MKPKSTKKVAQEELFRSHIDQLLNMNHELVKLSELIDWDSLDQEWGALFQSDKVSPLTLLYLQIKSYTVGIKWII